ncbi:MAG TPA: dTDP-4-dehydrorhamnose reductase [Candidatus Absconditabacterales bacterium]|nr:dTDP-4-dehydrorhamnose reductase [Candidatus Absconditabacterales bacterium]
MKILITGSSGMLAHDLIPILKRKYKVVGYDKNSLDITNLSSIENILNKEKIDIVVNCAAYTDVEKAEDEGKLLNYQVNTLGVYNLAKVCNKLNIDIVHISTDYVFDGTQKEGYLPTDKPNPINEYGMAKYLGEQLLQTENKNAIIVRTSWLYGGGKQFKNFVNTMLKLSETKKELKIVGDQFGAPTYTKDLSTAILDIVGDINKYKGKKIHCTNQTDNDGISWYDFAKEIFKLSGNEIKLEKCNSDEFVTKATRPEYSKLINKSKIPLGDWEKSLKKYINIL